MSALTQNTAEKKGLISPFYKEYSTVLILTIALALYTFFQSDFLIRNTVSLLLCLYCFVKGKTQIDLWILIPLFAIPVLGLLSTYINQLDFYANYTLPFMALAIIYCVLSYCSQKERDALRRVLIVWGALIGIVALCNYIIQAQQYHAARLNTIIGNPNTSGLVFAFLLLCFLSYRKKWEEVRSPFLCAEPLLITSLCLTLSVSSIASFGVGVVVYFIYQKAIYKNPIIHMVSSYICCLFIGFAIALLLYTAANYTNAPWLCIILGLYLVAVSLFWHPLVALINQHALFARIGSMASIVAIIALVTLRPNALLSFQDRLAMIADGLTYAGLNPLFGIGPLQWYHYNTTMSGTPFNTFFIHNVFMHTVVELGFFALLCLIILIIRFGTKQHNALGLSLGVAFLLHSLVDTALFIPLVPLVFMLMTAQPQERGIVFSDKAIRIISVLYLVCLSSIGTLYIYLLPLS